MQTLKELQDFYSSTLCHRFFEYHLANGDVVKVHFFRESFCHLLGIQHITNNRRFLGEKGVSRMHEEKITLKTLKGLNKKGFEYVRNRIQYFDHLDGLLKNGDLYYFYPDRVSPPSKIYASILIYDEEAGLYLNLFLSKERSHKNLYTPISFIPFSEKDDHPKRYQEHQEYKKILSRQILRIPEDMQDIL